MGAILSAVWKLIKGFLMIVGLLTMIYMVGKSMGRVKPGVSIAKDEKVVLHTTLSGRIQAYESGQSFWQRLMRSMSGEEDGPYLLNLRSWLETAAKDEQVAGLFVKVEDLKGSYADFAELAAVINHFRASEKPVQIWLQEASTLPYYLAATSADKVSIPPISDIDLTGPVLSQVYFGDALRKLGAEIEVVRNGKYKSAFEPFVNNAPSSETEEEYAALEADLRRFLIEGISEGRNHEDSQKARLWLKKSWYTAQESLDEGIVDEIAYSDASKKAFAEPLKAKLVDLDDYLDLRWEPSEVSPVADGLAFIEISGAIKMGPGGSDAGADPEHVFQEIEWAQKSSHIKGVLLRVDSPGGSALASDLIWQRLKDLGQAKPLVASFGGVAASGGYYVSAAAKKIFASEPTITGSIGVISMFVKLIPFSEKFGVHFFNYSQSDRHNYLNPGRRASEEDKRLLRANSDQVYSRFLEAVAEGRGKASEAIHEVGQGRVWTGNQAHQRGLVDEIGGMWEALQETKILAGFDPESKVPIHTYTPEIQSLGECLSNLDRCIPSQHSIIPRPATQVEAYVREAYDWLALLASERTWALGPLLSVQ